MTKLILTNIHIDRWIFKINGYYEGRGIAYFDLTSIKKLKRIRRKITAKTPEELFTQTQQLILRFLPSKLKIVRKTLFRDFQEYVDEFIRKGGMIEAAPGITQKELGTPGISFFIEPNGEIEFLGSFEKICGGLMTPVGYEMPQQSLPNIDVKNLRP